jgi:hypothetical protein
LTSIYTTCLQAGKLKKILEILAKHGSMAARQSSGVRDSKIHKVNVGELSEAAI